MSTSTVSRDERPLQVNLKTLTHDLENDDVHLSRSLKPLKEGMKKKREERMWFSRSCCLCSRAPNDWDAFIIDRRRWLEVKNGKRRPRFRFYSLAITKCTTNYSHPLDKDESKGPSISIIRNCIGLLADYHGVSPWGQPQFFPEPDRKKRASTACP
jgi:hypothetical protein